jgi:hypothetical protein
MEVDRSDLESSHMAGCGVSSVESLGSAIRVLQNSSIR